MKGSGTGSSGALRDLAVLLLSAVAIFLSLQQEGDFSLTATWFQEIDPYANSYRNGHAPVESETVPLPIITDMDGDGLNEVVIVTREPKIKILKNLLPGERNKKLVRSSKVEHKNDGGISAAEAGKSNLVVYKEASLLSSVSVKTGRQVIAMATGYLSRYSSRKSRKQVIIVVTEGYHVLCFDDRLRLRWERTIGADFKDRHLGEIAVTISSHPLRRGDRGMVMIGGRLVSSKNFESYGLELGVEKGTIGKENKLNAGASEDEKDLAEKQKQELKEDRAGFDRDKHFSYFAFDGKTGKMRWKHEAGDFHEEGHAHDALHPQHDSHLGEVDWTRFRHDILKSLPHYWDSRQHNVFEIAHFQKRRAGQDRKSKMHHQQNVKVSRWTEDLKLFGGTKLRPHADSEHIKKPNAIVAHLRDGVEIIHMFTGRTLSHLALKPSALHVDLNGDGVIDHIEAVGFDPASEGHRSDSESLSCVALVSSGIPPIAQLFNGTICGKSLKDTIGIFSVTKQMGAAEKRIRVARPAVLKLPTRSGSRPRYESLFFVNTGTVTCFGPEGSWKWSTDTHSTWLTSEDVDETLATGLKKQSLNPSLQSFALRAGDDEHKSMIAVLGEDLLTVLDAHGYKHATATLHDLPIASAVFGDFNNDEANDIIVVTASGYYGYVFEKRIGVKFFSVLLVLLIVCLLLSFLVKYVAKGKQHGAVGADNRQPTSIRSQFLKSMSKKVKD